MADSGKTEAPATGDRIGRCATVAFTTSVRLYNVIRAVGHGEITADNALHQLVEDYKNLHDLGEELLGLADETERG